MNEVLSVAVTPLVKTRSLPGHTGMSGSTKYFPKENKNHRFISIDSNLYKKDSCRCTRITTYLFYRHPTVLYTEGTTNLHQIASSLETPCSQSLSTPGQAQTGTPPRTGTGWRKWRVGTDQTWGQTWPWCCLDFPLHSAPTGHSASKWPADSPHSYQKIITGIN